MTSSSPSDPDFREAVKLYIDLHDEIDNVQKNLKDVRKRRDDLGNSILQHMRSKDIDECQLPDGGKLVRKLSKRTEALKKDHIVKELRNALGGDDMKVQTVLTNIFSLRSVEQKESLQRKKS